MSIIGVPNLKNSKHEKVNLMRFVILCKEEEKKKNVNKIGLFS